MKLIHLLIIGLFLSFSGIIKAQHVKKITFDCNHTYQTIHSFGASDCWRTQYIGKNWPLEKREQMAKLLFSTDLDKDGNPAGIGLSLWRFNIGSGSHEAGDRSGVSSDWRRTECFLDSLGNWNWNKQEGQRWFLSAAQQYKISYTLGFSITAPYFMTKNGMARASEKDKYANLKEDKYDDYAQFMAVVCEKLKLDYLSPINEPQWEWVGSNQEGMQATNEECRRLIKEIDLAIKKLGSNTKVVFGEAGDIRYLYRSGTDKPDRDNQINEMFRKEGKHSIAHLPSVENIISGHSYWSTFPLDTLIITRQELNKNIQDKLPNNFEYWQTEYCPMEQNPDNPNGGGGRDLGMNTALYIARIIHHDLTLTNATSWQSWTTFTEWDYKDGLIYIDDGIQTTGARSGNDSMVETCKYDGAFRTSKYMWALGNYSLFVRPGMVRIGEGKEKTHANLLEEAQTLMYSAYVDKETNKKVIVFLNYGEQEENIEISFLNSQKGNKAEKYKYYETSEYSDLYFKGIVGQNCTIPARSVVTLVSE